MVSKSVVSVAATLIGGVYAVNASWMAPEPTGVPVVLAHRAMYQHSRPKFAEHETCSAERLNPPIHPYFEDTIPSIRASFAAGATAVEVDVHPTVDGEFAVFHDDTLDCRTNGRGAVRAQSMAYLRTLDVGYGYTVDGGRTFPFRGKGVGMIKTLHEVLAAFPDKTILIDIKGDDAPASARLVAYLEANGHPTDQRLWVWAEGAAYHRLRELAPAARVISTRRAKACVVRYLATGWSGHTPAACRGATIFVPSNLRWAYWGWPNRFLARMKQARTEVLLTGPLNEREPGVSRSSELDTVPARFPGIIMTDRIELIGPEVRRRWGDTAQS